METILETKLYQFLEERFEEQKIIETKPNSGGLLREFSGKTVEIFVDKTVELLNEKYQINLISKVGSENPFTICDLNGNKIKESVDRHIYLNNKLLSCVECKTYLDKCYLQRADSDFSLMKEGNENFSSCVLSLENSIDENSKEFLLNRKNVDKLFILFNGKRSSAKDKRIYKTYKERKNTKALEDWVHYIEELINEK